MLGVPRPILVCLTALATLVLAVNCACARTIAAPQQNVKPCCAARHATHGQPAPACPHCQGTGVQAEAAERHVSPVAVATSSVAIFAKIFDPVCSHGLASSPAERLGWQDPPPTLLALYCCSLT